MENSRVTKIHCPECGNNLTAMFNSEHITLYSPRKFTPSIAAVPEEVEKYKNMSSEELCRYAEINKKLVEENNFLRDTIKTLRMVIDSNYGK